MSDPVGTKHPLECARHPLTIATGSCIVCGMPVCDECSVHDSEGLVCHTDDHRSIARLWTVVHRSPSEFEADMVSKNLAIREIETKVYSSRAFKLTIGEDSEDVVRIFVRKENLGRARTALQDIGLTDVEE